MLARGGEPELDFGGTEGDDVAVAKPRGSLRFFIDGRESVGGGLKDEAFVFLKFQREVVFPDSSILQAQIIFDRTADAKRKMADDPEVARPCAGNNVELNHQR